MQPVVDSIFYLVNNVEPTLIKKSVKVKKIHDLCSQKRQKKPSLSDNSASAFMKLNQLGFRDRSIGTSRDTDVELRGKFTGHRNRTRTYQAGKGPFKCYVMQ